MMPWKKRQKSLFGQWTQNYLQIGLAMYPGFGLAVVDLDGNLASEFWESRYPGIPVDGADSDGDGMSNFDEMVAGTDPTDSQSLLRLGTPTLDEDGIEFQWDGIAGKVYRIQKWNGETSSWESLVTINPSVIDEGRTVEISRTGSGGLYRVATNDIDEDDDGVSAWEEALLGWDDGDPNGSGSPTTPDYEMAVSLLEQPGGAELVGGETLAQRLPDEAEASRFLVQTTFGPTSESIQEVMDKGMTGWFTDQLAVPPTITRSEMFRSGQPIGATYWRHGWWRSVLGGEDQLRHRMAYALSQIFVVNNEPGTVIGDNAITHAEYFDPFVREAFGNYRDVLEHVTYSPSMGFYLSHLNNRKSDVATNRFPDENFAREIMQLFSIGLWKLNLDGSHLKDIEGNSIPTYDNAVITELAKVFTGMSNGTTNRGFPATSFYDPATGDDFKKPMKVWDEEHETGPKELFDGVIIPDGQTGEEDVQQTLDALASHDNTAPFVSRLLIQRFTSSNPSRDYLRRVSQAWLSSSGNFEKVIRAIIFDPEARAKDAGEGTRGKVREPLIRMTHIMRAFAPADVSGSYGVSYGILKDDLGQFAMSSPTVFNFYLPDYSPIGPLNDLNLVSPELQIATSSNLLATHDRLKGTAFIGHFNRGIDYTEELGMLGDADSLIDHLDVLLTFGTLSEITRAAVRDRLLDEIGGPVKVGVAVQIIATSPEFSVLK